MYPRKLTITRRLPILVVLAGSLLGIRPAIAQVNLSGDWQSRQIEDAEYRGQPGARPGESLGVPYNPAGILKAQSWDPAMIGAPERMCMIYAPDLIFSEPNAIAQFAKDVDPFSNRIVAWRVRHNFQSSEMTYWMDGRPHPDEYAPHTYQGFSTAQWEGNGLTVTTTHLKEAQLIRNGTDRSDQATITEHWIRHGKYLTDTIVVYDPVWLAEPYVKSWTFMESPEAHMMGYRCRSQDEVGQWKPGTVLHFLPGKNPFLEESAAKIGVPKEALVGGPETIYPEYMLKLKTLPKPISKASK